MEHATIAHSLRRDLDIARAEEAEALRHANNLRARAERPDYESALREASTKQAQVARLQLALRDHAREEPSLRAADIA